MTILQEIQKIPNWKNILQNIYQDNSENSKFRNFP